MNTSNDPSLNKRAPAAAVPGLVVSGLVMISGRFAWRALNGASAESSSEALFLKGLDVMAWVGVVSIALAILLQIVRWRRASVVEEGHR